MKTVLVAGGAGFIDSALVRNLTWHSDYRGVVFDKLTYAGNLESLASIAEHQRYVIEKGDIRNQRKVKNAFIKFEPEAVMHLAAESHVDRSIDGPAEFIATHIIGTSVLLEISRGYRSEREDKHVIHFHHVSTDEVSGAL